MKFCKFERGVVGAVFQAHSSRISARWPLVLTQKGHKRGAKPSLVFIFKFYIELVEA